MPRRWLVERKKEVYYKKAKKEDMRSRAAFKIIQLNERYKLIKQGNKILDLGSAPGGWLKAIKEMVGGEGLIIGIDIQPILPIEGVITIIGDITNENIIEEIKKINPIFDVITSDCSPNVSGNWNLDHARQIYLAEKALDLCHNLLKLKGNFIVKVFQGEFFEEFINNMRKKFFKVIITKPEASRKKSSEVYILGKSFNLKRD